MRFVLGIAGPPGAGKSTFAAALAECLGHERAVVLPMDGFHEKDSQLERQGLLERKGAPETFDRHAFSLLLHAARVDDATHWPGYDRARHAVVPNAIELDPAHDILIVEGNYLLHWAAIRAQLDLCWYLDVPAETRHERLLSRHIEGGRPPASAHRRIATNDDPNALIVERSRGRASRCLTLAEVADPSARAEELTRERRNLAGRR